jgi:hypothetical protein
VNAEVLDVVGSVVVVIEDVAVLGDVVVEIVKKMYGPL